MKSQPEIRHCNHCGRTYKYTFTDKARDQILAMKGEFTSSDLAWSLGCEPKDLSVILYEMKMNGEIFVVREKRKGCVKHVTYSLDEPETSHFKLWDVPA